MLHCLHGHLVLTPVPQMAMRGLGFNVSKDEASRIIMRYSPNPDPSGSPLIDECIGRRDFVDVMAQRYRTRDPVAEMYRAFRLFDRDNSGRIT